jgi:hypothetical protein
MANRYAVKSATLTFGSTTYDMASGPAMKAETKDAVETTALSDQVKQFITGALKEVDEFTVSLYQKGTGDITVDDTPAALTIAVTLENGGTDVTASVAYAKAIVTKVAPPSLDASGDRKAVYDVTFRPDGSVAAQGNA